MSVSDFAKSENGLKLRSNSTQPKTNSPKLGLPLDLALAQIPLESEINILVKWNHKSSICGSLLHPQKPVKNTKKLFGRFFMSKLLQLTTRIKICKKLFLHVIEQATYAMKRKINFAT